MRKTCKNWPIQGPSHKQKLSQLFPTAIKRVLITDSLQISNLILNDENKGKILRIKMQQWLKSIREAYEQLLLITTTSKYYSNAPHWAFLKGIEIVYL